MKKLKLIALIGILAVALGAVTAQADLITNGSFETGSAPGTYIPLFAGDTTTIPGWSVTSDNGFHPGIVRGIAGIESGGPTQSQPVSSRLHVPIDRK